MLRSSVGELLDWVYETIYEYDMATSLSKCLVSQEEFALGEAGYEPSRSTGRLM